MEVSTLVSQMNETLSTIHNTIASLNTAEHDARLDELEQEREKHLQALHTAFSDESSAIGQKRKAEREEIAERRRKEDEEIARRRRLEDEKFAAKARAEDEERDGDLREHTKEVEEKTDHLMAQVEEEAQRMLEEGKERLRVLEEKRKELNRLIDEQLQMPLPPPPTRARRSTRGGSIAPAVAIESKRLETTVEAVQPMSNPIVKAHEDDSDRGYINDTEILPPTTYSPEPVEVSFAVPDISVATRSEDTTVVEEEEAEPEALAVEVEVVEVKEVELASEAVAQTHVADEVVEVEDDVPVPRSYPTEQEGEEEEEEEELSIAEIPVLSRCNSRDPSAEMRAQSAVVEYEDDVASSDYDEEGQLSSSADVHEEALAAENAASLPSDQIQEEVPVSSFEDIRDMEASVEHVEDLREGDPATVSADMHAQVPAAEYENDLGPNSVPEHGPIASAEMPARDASARIEDGDSSFDHDHPREPEPAIYPADAASQPTLAEQEEASPHHEQSPQEEPVTRLRSDSAELAWWEQKRLDDLSDAAASAESVQEQAEGFYESETTAGPDTMERTADEEPSIVTGESPAISHSLDQDLKESEVHVVSGDHEVQHDEDAVDRVHGVESSPDLDSELQKETRSVDSVDGSADDKEDWPLKDEEADIAGADGIRGAGTPELTLNTKVADKGEVEVITAAVEYMQNGITSPTSTTDNNMHTASVSTPVANIEFISKMVNEELDMVETSPVDILSVGSPFDGDSSFDNGHQHSQSTADTSLSNGQERVYQDSVSEYGEEREHEHVNAKSLSDELQGHDHEGFEDGEMDGLGVQGDLDTYTTETVVADPAVRQEEVADEHVNSNVEAQEMINSPIVEEEHETSVQRHDEPTFEAVDESHSEPAVADEGHTGDYLEHQVSEEHLKVAEEIMHTESTVEGQPYDQYSAQSVEVEPAAGDHQYPLQENHEMSQEEDGHYTLRSGDELSHSAVVHDEEVQVSHATATDPHDQLNSADAVADGYFDHEVHELSNSEETTHSAGHMMPLATSNTDAESQSFFTPLASAEFRSPTTAENSTAEEIHQNTGRAADGCVDEPHQIETKNSSTNRESYSSDISTGVGLNRTSTNGDSYVDEQDSNNGYESSQHELELEDGYSTTVHGQDHLFDDDHSDDSIDRKDITPTDKAVNWRNPFGHDGNKQGDDLHDHVLRDYAEPPVLEDNAKHEGHYKYEPDTPVAAEVMFSADHDAHEEPADRKGSWADEFEQHAPVEERVEHPSLGSSSDPERSYEDDRKHGKEHDQPAEITTASDPSPMQQEQEEPKTSLPTIEKGLSASRHNPERPQTPEQSTHHHSADHSSPEDSFAPRDVTNVPWHSRTESTPLSLRSGSTASSSPSSPVHASLLSDNHEPVIRESWPTPGSHNYSPFRGLSSVTGRPRTDSHLTDYSQENGGNNTKLGPSPMRLWQRREHDGEYQRPSSVVEISTSREDGGGVGVGNNSAGSRNSVGGSLFQRMRSVFENQAGGQAASQEGTSPTVSVRSRASSNLFTRNSDAQQVKVSSSRDGLVRPGDVAAAYDGRDYDYGYGDEDAEGEHSSLLIDRGRYGDRRLSAGGGGGNLN